MIRGTTPTITIRFPFEVDSDISKFVMYLNQGKDTVLTKTLSRNEILLSGYTASATLTQEDTYMFSPKKRVEVTARYKFLSGTVGAIKPRYIDVYDIDGSTDEVL